MSNQTEFFSSKKNFRANGLSANVIGAPGYFNLFKVGTGEKIGIIFGKDASFQAAYTGLFFSTGELSEITKLCTKIKIALG